MGIKERKILKRYFFVFSLIFFFLPILLCPAQSEEKKGHPKIGSWLFDLKEKYFLGGKTILRGLPEGFGSQLDEEDRVVVFLLPEPGKSKDGIDTETLKALGCEIVKSGDTVVKAKVPVLMIDIVADYVEGVSFIDRPGQPLADVVSEGVALTGAPGYHASGDDGDNVKVAVIDSGFAGLSEAILNGALPNSVIKIDCTGTGCIPTTFSSETEIHGTAVAEIIYNMAPGAQLYLMKIDDELDLRDAKDYCIANGIRIINHSIGWFNTNFYDGSCYFDNPVCTANHAYKNDILWVNAAGNSAQKHYGAVFNDRDGDRLHNVASGDNYISLNAIAGQPIVALLTWDAWPVTDQDYDLILYDSTMTRVAGSMGWQNGSQPPRERISYVAPTSGTYYLAVKRYKTTSDHRFELFVFYQYLSPAMASSSIASPADGSGVIAVGAIDWADWLAGPQEAFSSQGPTTDGRIKPDISGPDGVSTFTFRDFFGTSASAPHVVGAAALILSNNPTFTASQLWDSLTFSAIDMGVSGMDTVYGFGRLNLPLLFSTISVFPTPIDFGGLVVGTTGERLATINNNGNGSLLIGVIGSPPEPFQIVKDNCSEKELPFGESCTFTVQFSPPSAGLFSGSLSIPSNDPQRNPSVIDLSGSGIFDITLSLPSDQALVDGCTFSSRPVFKWNSVGSFKSYELQFSGDPAFSAIPVKAVSKKIEKTISSNIKWKKILKIPGNQGGKVYWRVKGTKSDGETALSDLRTLVISGCQ